MKLASFDIFDTCLLRKCGTVVGFYDILALRVFNGTVPEHERKGFAVARKKAEDKLWNENGHLRLWDIYNEIPYKHSLLKPIAELVEIEIALEREMLVPSVSAKALVDKCRASGKRIIFISDMYLSDEFIREELVSFGFFHEGDGLYVSSTCGCKKQSGDLFKYVGSRETITFRNWHHYGDNSYSDVTIPASLGIRSTRFVNDYSPYQKSWLTNDFAIGFDYPQIIAGISRAICLSASSLEHKRYCSFVTDLVAPFYCSYVYNVLQKSYNHGIRHLFFCARDSYQIFQVADQMKELFPQMKIDYLYVSRDSLYSGDDGARLAYFEQIGLARHDATAAIVDITTSGKTILELNSFLESNGYCKVRGYFFLLWDDPRNIPVDRDVCCFEVEAQNMRNKEVGHHLLNHLYVFENFFALNTQSRTIDYQVNNGISEPIFEDKLTETETKICENRMEISEYFTSLLLSYTKNYISTGVYAYSKEIMQGLAIPTLSSFFQIPNLHYLPALEKYFVYSPVAKTHVPYVICSLKAFSKKRFAYSKWCEASILWSLPSILRPLYRERLKTR